MKCSSFFTFLVSSPSSPPAQSLLSGSISDNLTISSFLPGWIFLWLFRLNQAPFCFFVTPHPLNHLQSYCICFPNTQSKPMATTHGARRQPIIPKVNQTKTIWRGSAEPESGHKSPSDPPEHWWGSSSSPPSPRRAERPKKSSTAAGARLTEQRQPSPVPGRSLLRLHQLPPRPDSTALCSALHRAIKHKR